MSNIYACTLYNVYRGLVNTLEIYEHGKELIIEVCIPLAHRAATRKGY